MDLQFISLYIGGPLAGQPNNVWSRNKMDYVTFFCGFSEGAVISLGSKVQYRDVCAAAQSEVGEMSE